MIILGSKFSAEITCDVPLCRQITVIERKTKTDLDEAIETALSKNWSYQREDGVTRYYCKLHKHMTNPRAKI
jgi:hypothetical protein